MSRKIRLWFHAGQWRIQDHRQLPDRYGVLQDAWESRCENGRVMFFETEEQARAYMQSGRANKL